jgi:tripartite-type tricarboxylate transporter receptor subunit TctC
MAMAAALLAASAVWALPAMAADFPSKPIKMLVGFRAGGSVDTLARLMARTLEKELGQPIVVQNKPGAGGGVTAGLVRKAAKDGHTIGMAVSNTFAANPVLSKKAKYGPGDFTYLGSAARGQCAWMVRADSPYKSVKGMLAAAKAGKSVAFGSLSPVTKLVVRYVARKAGVKIKVITLKGGAGILQGVLGGHVDFGFSGGIHVPHQKAGKIRVLASVDDRRLAGSPDRPTLQELGYDISQCSFFLNFAPKGLPGPVTAKLARAVKAAVKSGDVQSLLKKRQLPEFYRGPQDIARILAKENAGWKRVRKALK